MLPVEVVRSRRRHKTVQAREVDGRLQVLIPSWMSAADEARWVAEMQRRMANRSPAVDDAALVRRAVTLARRYRLPAPTSVRWSDRQGRRWGSCTPSTGTIRISSRLAKAPVWVLDYVLVHELAHLVVGGHDARFHALVDRYPKAQRAQGFLEAWGISDIDPADEVVGLHHARLPMPPGREAEAEAFYTGILGLPRLKGRPCRFGAGSSRLHLEVDYAFRAARRSYPALRVRGLTAIVGALTKAGYDVRWSEDADRAWVDDPFGNLLGLVEDAAE